EEKNATLEDTQQFISSVLTSMSDLLIVCSRAGVIESVNEALASLLGLEAAALHGRTIFDLFADEESRQRAGRLFADLGGQAVEDVEMQLKAANGSAIPVSLNCTPRYNGVGKMLGLVITGRPVGELRRAYQALRRAHEDLKTTQQQLIHSEKLASLGRLVAGVAHELNNPISFVYGNTVAMKRYAERLSRYLAAVHADMPKNEREALRQELHIDRLLDDLPSLIDGTVEGAERTRDIVDALKRFSVTDRDERLAFDLVEVIERAVQWVGKATAYQFEIKQKLPASITVAGSPGQVQQVVMNLVQNAADATENQRERWLEIAGHIEEQDAVIEFRDSGPGIPAENLVKLFDPFFTTKSVGRGTGLGLAISYGIVERHGGKLTVSNHPKGGALFCLRLPLAK
ncbi:MAG: PAS domain S-box protein, partial [Sulfuritalea sp.]|nr:PAS domain S-box protein [Sulfuritalea sp.]